MSDGEAVSVKIFVSYRRADSSGHVGWLCEALGDEFGEHNIFRDLTGIRAAHDFTVAVVKAIEDAHVVVAVVGPAWLRGRLISRMVRREDWVFRELESARALGKHILPVLVNGAKMPSSASLPKSVRFFSNLNAIQLRDDSWDTGVGHLTKEIVELAKAPPLPVPASASGVQPELSGRWTRRIAVAVGTGILGAGTALLWPKPTPRDPIQPFVRITTTRADGRVFVQTGVLVSPTGHIVTVTPDSLTRPVSRVHTSDGLEYSGRIVKQKRLPNRSMVAVLQIPLTGAAHARLSEREIEPGANIVAWGAIEGKQNFQPFSARVDSVSQGMLYYQRLEEQWYGLMGAPIMDRSDNAVIGFHIGSAPPEVTSAYGYALRSLSLQALLHQTRIRIETSDPSIATETP
jgi:hypothetical protein